VGDITVAPTSGAIVLNGGPQTLSTTTGCPAGYRNSSRVYLIWPDGTYTPAHPAGSIVTATSSTSGLGGLPITRTGTDASRWGTAAFPTSHFAGHDGKASYVITCDEGNSTSGNVPLAPAGVGNAKYFSVDLLIQYGDGANPTWKVFEDSDLAGDSESDVGVSVPTEIVPTSPTGLSIAVTPGSTTLTGPVGRVQGQPWQATGTLENVTVNDDRRDATAPGWTLTGRVSAFVAGANSIASTNLGWTPALVSGPGAAGPAVAPSQNGGLSTDKTLATGPASAAEDVETTVNAAFVLNVPTGTPAGDYHATLTLTLI
jgi:hypothetical protein